MCSSDLGFLQPAVCEGAIQPVLPVLPNARLAANRKTPLNPIRTYRILRTVIVTMTLAGWFVLSNHCALGRMAQTPQVKKEHACCHNGDSKPAKEPAEGKQGVQCCKSLSALMPDSVKDAALTPPTFVVAVLGALFDLEAQTEKAVVLAIDTGPPPRAASFSELVLHRSLRSHAPPLLA